MLNEKDFLQKIGEKAETQRREARKRRKQILAVTCSLCLLLVLLPTILIFAKNALIPQMNNSDYSGNYNGSSDKETFDFTRDPGTSYDCVENTSKTLPDLLFDPPLIEAWICPAEDAIEAGLNRAEEFGEDALFLVFTVEQCPPSDLCKIETREEKGELFVTVVIPEQEEKQERTVFCLPIEDPTSIETIRLMIE